MRELEPTPVRAGSARESQERGTAGKVFGVTGKGLVCLVGGVVDHPISTYAKAYCQGIPS